MDRERFGDVTRCPIECECIDWTGLSSLGLGRHDLDVSGAENGSVDW